MKKNLLLLMLALLLPAFMYGQEQTVSGTVLDTYNMGVPGASIVEKGTTNGTITDFDGNYTLTVSNKKRHISIFFHWVQDTRNSSSWESQSRRDPTRKRRTARRSSGNRLRWLTKESDLDNLYL